MAEKNPWPTDTCGNCWWDLWPVDWSLIMAAVCVIVLTRTIKNRLRSK